METRKVESGFFSIHRLSIFKSYSTITFGCIWWMLKHRGCFKLKKEFTLGYLFRIRGPDLWRDKRPWCVSARLGTATVVPVCGGDRTLSAQIVTISNFVPELDLTPAILISATRHESLAGGVLFPLDVGVLMGDSLLRRIPCEDNTEVCLRTIFCE